MIFFGSNLKNLYIAPSKGPPKNVFTIVPIPKVPPSNIPKTRTVASIIVLMYETGFPVIL